jgi:hypothetical protein
MTLEAAMLFKFDPAAIRAELKTEGDHWVVAIEMATGRWGHAEISWNDVLITRDEIRNDIGDERASRDEDVIAYLEMSLRRAGWRAARRGQRVSPPVLEIWDLSPATDYVGPYHLFHRRQGSAEPQN